MAIKIENSDISDVYIGSSKVKKIYLGTTLLYQKVIKSVEEAIEVAKSYYGSNWKSSYECENEYYDYYSFTDMSKPAMMRSEEFRVYKVSNNVSSYPDHEVIRCESWDNARDRVKFYTENDFPTYTKPTTYETSTKYYVHCKDAKGNIYKFYVVKENGEVREEY